VPARTCQAAGHAGGLATVSERLPGQRSLKWPCDRLGTLHHHRKDHDEAGGSQHHPPDRKDRGSQAMAGWPACESDPSLNRPGEWRVMANHHRRSLIGFIRRASASNWSASAYKAFEPWGVLAPNARRRHEAARSRNSSASSVGSVIIRQYRTAWPRRSGRRSLQPVSDARPASSCTSHCLPCGAKRSIAGRDN